MRLSTITWTCFYFILLMCLAWSLMPLGVPSPVAFIPHQATNDTLINYFGYSDPGSFAHGARSVALTGWFDVPNTWLINLWPPGFMYFQGILLKSAGINAPIVLIMQMFAAFFLACAFNLFRLTLANFLKQLPAALLPLILLLTPQFRLFMLNPDCVMLGETFSISFVMIGLFSCILACRENKLFYALAAGFFFALSAYFRTQFETFFFFVTIIVVIAFLTLLYLRYRRTGLLPKLILKPVTPFVSLLFAVIAFQCVTLPYRVYTYHRIHETSWVQTLSILWVQSFSTTDDLMQNGSGFIAQGGGNIACLTDPKKCATLSLAIKNNKYSQHELAHAAISIFFHHPYKWISLKLAYLPSYWFINISSFFSLVMPVVDYYALDNYLFIISFIFAAGWSIVNFKKTPEAFICGTLGGAFVLAYGAIFTVDHFEVRYFFFIKYYFAISAMIALAAYLKNKKTYFSNNNF